ncbi:MAG TPA: helix-turn-helix transcriptional regulator [Syntrophomonadaceae bacterium]|nr:helix-turn-helix transcriptional regulator [Syntrophomonadaceae bacterium]
MFFPWGFHNKTVKHLRKNIGMTAKELAERAHVAASQILKVDDMKLKEVREPLRSKITPVLKGNDTDKMPWL